MRGRSQVLDMFRLWDSRPGPIPLDELLASLKSLEIGPDDLGAARVFDERAYHRAAIYRAEHFEALVLCWRGGQCSPIHDHTGSSCAVRVVAGRATEIRYGASPCGRLNPRYTRASGAGAVLGCTGDGMHQLGNLEAPGHDLVTLHVYSPPPRAWRYYAIDRTCLADNDRMILARPETMYLDLAEPIARARKIILRVDPSHDGSFTEHAPASSKTDGRESIATTTANLGRARSSADAEVAIVGSGFSGTMVAVQLARMGVERVTLFERARDFARGVAYGTSCDRHLLNVPAGLMSALPDDPSHFVDWLRAREFDVQPSTFVPRRTYGEYLGDLLGSANGVARIHDEVVDIQTNGDDEPVLMLTREGRRITADRVVLALGHQPPESRTDWVGPMHPGQYVADPWSPAALDGLPCDESVALIGTGLTAVDLVIEARARGHRGTFHAISRHGLLPSRHAAAPSIHRPHFTVAGPGSSGTPTRARELLRKVRSEAKVCEAEGGDWRSVIDTLRPQIPAIWASLPDRERQRFLRHMATRWDSYRHRIAPAVDDELLVALRAGRLVVTAARVTALSDRAGRVAVTFRRRGESAPETLLVGRVINCTGPGRDIRASPSVLMRSIISRGVGRPGPLALGLDVTDSGQLVDDEGRPQDRIFALGPLLKERDWESTAVRELRTQALDLARRLRTLV